MAYNRIVTQNGITRMNTQLYDNLQDGIDELKSSQIADIMFSKSIICNSKRGGLLLKRIIGKTIQGANPSYSSPQAFTHAGTGGFTYSIQNRNLLKFGNKTSTWNGITYALKDGMVTVTGKSTMASNSQELSSFNNLPEGDYFLFGCPSGGGSTSMYLQADVRYNNGETYKYYDYGSGVVVPIMSGLKSCDIDIITVLDYPANAIFKPVFQLNGENHEFVKNESQTISIPLTGSLRSIPSNNASLITHVDENGVTQCADDIDMERGIKTMRTDTSVVSITSIITLANGKVAGVCPISGKKNGSGFGCLCDRAIYDESKSGVEGTFYEDGTNVIFVGNTNDTLDTLKTKYNGAGLIYVMSSFREIAIDTTKLIEVYGLLSYDGSMSITCSDDNVNTIIGLPTTDCAGITCLSYNIAKQTEMRYAILNATLE